jgi:hypothetical protein
VTSADRGKQVPAGKAVRIARVNPDQIRPAYANDFLVTHTEREFFFTFSLLEPLGVMDPKELEGINEVAAIAVAKIVVSPRLAQEIVNVLSGNLETHRKSYRRDDEST